jgi:hypothetical protein
VQGSLATLQIKKPGNSSNQEASRDTAEARTGAKTMKSSYPQKIAWASLPSSPEAGTGLKRIEGLNKNIIST